MKVKEYMVWQCPKCNKWQVRHQEKLKRIETKRALGEYMDNLSVRCSQCGKSKQFRSKTQGGAYVSHKWVNPAEYAEANGEDVAREMAKALNRRDNDGMTDFVNAGEGQTTLGDEA